MKIAAITMVHKDHWALSEWYRHYGTRIGYANLFVIAHGRDDEIQRICPEASVISIPRDDLAGFDRKRGEMMNGLHQGLLQVYDWVIRTDADELICLDPAHWTDFASLFGAVRVPVLFALGFDLVETPDDGPIGTLFETRRHAAFTGHYSKAFATCEALPLALHGVRVPPRRLTKLPHVIPEGVYLAHLKYANGQALTEMDALRAEIAGGDGKGLPGFAWKEAAADAEKFLTGFAAKRLVTWDEARREAFDALTRDPVRMEDRNVVKTRSERFGTRTVLPDWFAE